MHQNNNIQINASQVPEVGVPVFSVFTKMMIYFSLLLVRALVMAL